MNWSYKPNIVISVIAILAVIGLVLLFFQLQIQPQYGQIDKIKWDSGNNDKELVYHSFVIDNAVGVETVAGIKSADYIFEILVEGGTTRWLSIYNNQTLPNKIGPIRSARPYFINIANIFGGLFWHAGGSPQALDMLKNKDFSFVDINEISYQGKYFYRNNNLTPHNLFINRENILQAESDYKDFLEAKNVQYERKEDLSVEYRPKNDLELTIPYPAQTHNINWVYNKADNNWLRKQAGQWQEDSNGDIITAKNVVVIFTDTELIDIERLAIDLVGSGDGWLFRDGRQQAIKWYRKEGEAFVWQQGENKVKLNSGSTWINVLPDYLFISYN